MTRQESFKRRIRARMEKTGERYAAARRELIRQAKSHRRTWVSQPDIADHTLVSATGRGWDDWCDVIDASPVHDANHTEIAAYVRDVLGVDPWWAQGVTVGYERITGRRLPYQRPDGTFTASKSKTVTVDAANLRAMLIDHIERDALFPGHQTELRSKVTAKTLRLQIGPGLAQITIDSLPDGRSKVAVGHERLPTIDDVEQWRFYWTEWLDAIDG